MAQNDKLVSLKTVVIDAGHGGYDPGSLSPDKKTKEKTITLDIALKLGNYIKSAFPRINVIYTRDKDVYVPLAQRSDIANKNHADLFISIHVNSVKGTTIPNGTETFIMGADKSMSNMEVCKTENSVILLEDDYTTTYQGYDPNDPESFIFFNLMQNAFFEQSILLASLMQNNLAKGPIYNDRGIKQAPLLVLWKTTMPSVLVEVGFISNSSDRKSLTNTNKRSEIARRLFEAFVMFKNQYESGLVVDKSDQRVYQTEVQKVVPNVEKKVEPKAEPKVEKKVEPKVEKKVEPKVEKKVEPKAEPKVEKKVEPKVEPRATSSSAITVKIQIFATSKKVPENSTEFKNIRNYQCIYVDGWYKYLVGNYSSREDALVDLPALKSKFPGAFIVKVDKNGRLL